MQQNTIVPKQQGSTDQPTNMVGSAHELHRLLTANANPPKIVPMNSGNNSFKSLSKAVTAASAPTKKALSVVPGEGTSAVEKRKFDDISPSPDETKNVSVIDKKTTKKPENVSIEADTKSKNKNEDEHDENTEDVNVPDDDDQEDADGDEPDAEKKDDDDDNSSIDSDKAITVRTKNKEYKYDKQRRLAMNRASARARRQRKKELISTMQTECKKLKTENDQLRGKMVELQQTVDNFKSILFAQTANNNNPLKDAQEQQNQPNKGQNRQQQNQALAAIAQLLQDQQNQRQNLQAQLQLQSQQQAQLAPTAAASLALLTSPMAARAAAVAGNAGNGFEQSAVASLLAANPTNQNYLQLAGLQAQLAAANANTAAGNVATNPLLAHARNLAAANVAAGVGANGASGNNALISDLISRYLQQEPNPSE